MKVKIILGIIIILLIISSSILISNQNKLYQELSNYLYIEQCLSEDNEFLLQLISLKEYHYNDFVQVDSSNFLWNLLIPGAVVNPITTNNSTFYFSQDSVLRKINEKHSHENPDSILKEINEKYP